MYKVRYLGICLYGFEMNMSERVHFKVLCFYILQCFTLTGGLGVIKGVVRGVGYPPISHLFPITHPWVILVINTFI